MMTNQVSTGFDKLVPKVQKWIWDKGWTELRDIQEEAISPLLSADTDVIIASSTASGKTEAAYLPICSYLADNPGGGIRALYISPLKALIDDQFQRLEELCEYCDIPVHRWHGDVGTAKKRRLVEQPDGLLLITPESLEAIFVIHGTKIQKLFNNLSYVIVDELHAFLDNERGKQLQSLLCRLEIEIEKKVPRIGLSATIGDMSIAADFLRIGSGKEVRNVESNKNERELKLQIRGYKNVGPDLKNLKPDGEERIAAHIFRCLRGSHNLIFANARFDVEAYTDRLRRMSENQKLPNEFFPHHGNLSKEIRHEAESRVKNKDMPTNVICTSTLEMGIDIGMVQTIAQIGCPFSVAGMRQRLGRSGRKEGDPSILRIYVEEQEVTETSHPKEMLRERLFQSTAMVELLIRKWVEPPDEKILHLSTLIQQLLSIISQYGGVKAEIAWKVLCRTGAFKSVSQKEFIRLLRSLGEHDLLSQMHDGTLILGLQGERIVNHYSFFTAFVTHDEYRLVADGKTLGSLPISHPVSKGGYIIFAGRRWIVSDVKEEQKVILLQPSPAGKAPKFSSPGALVHDEIRKEMLKLYSSDYDPPYLNEEALKLFREGRDNFRRLKLFNCKLISSGGETLLFPWIGDKSINTLGVLLLSRGLRAFQSGFLLGISGTTPDNVISHLRGILKMESINPAELASIVETKIREKYDHFLPESLLCKEYASRFFDIPGALNCAASIIENYEKQSNCNIDRRNDRK